MVANKDASPDAGWYLQASNPGHERWWDGSAWSEHLRPVGTEDQSIPESASESDARGEDPETIEGATAAEARGSRFRTVLDRLPPRKLPRWAKLLFPLAVIAIIVAVVVGTRVPHVPSEADYRNGFSDIATALIASGGNWTQPAPYPSPLAPSDQERYEQVKTVFLDEMCSDLGKGEDATKLAIDVSVAYAKDNAISVDYTLAGKYAVIEAASKYICPQDGGVGDKMLSYVLLLQVTGS